MRVRDLAWGIPVWAAVALVAAFAVTGPLDQWDMSIGAAVGVLVGFAAAFGAAGAIIWLPGAVWLERATKGRSRVVRAVLFTVMGFAIGAAVVVVLVLASGNATWPYVLGPLFQIAGATAASSLGGWWVAATASATGLRADRAAQA